MFVAAKKQRLVVVEGYMDCIMATQFGYGAVVAPLGTSMTVSQVKQVMVVDKNPLICFNSDKAGLVAMVRCAKMFLPEIKPGTAPSFVILKNCTEAKTQNQGKACKKELKTDKIPLFKTSSNQAMILLVIFSFPAMSKGIKVDFLSKDSTMENLVRLEKNRKSL